MRYQRLRGVIPDGSVRWFEYHCWEDPRSDDADLWYRSHQQVRVVQRVNTDRTYAPTPEERAHEGDSLSYLVEFLSDGYQDTIGEDELLLSRDEFERPDPPKRANRWVPRI